MRITEVAIRRPVFAWMLMSGLIIFGAISAGRLGVSYLPDVDFPVLSIRVEWEGAAPGVMEAELVDRIERRIVAVEGLKQIRSSVSQGSADISLEFKIERNVDTALQEVQTALSRLDLPAGVLPPTIRKSNPEEDPILWIGIASEKRSIAELFILADKIMIDRIQLVDGVGEVFVGGSAERNLRVWIDNDKLKKYQLTALDVRDALRQEHAEGAAGYLENELQERTLRALGEAGSFDAVGNIPITRRGGRPIYFTSIKLKDVARIEDGLNDNRRITRVSGREGLSMGIRKRIGANTVSVGQGVKAELERLRKDLPADIRIETAFDATVFVEEAIDETVFTLVLSGILTALVCWLFLGNLSATFNVVLAIPTSIVGTFIILYFLGFTLNLFTLLGLSLAIGIVVDDTIMVLENIMRHFEMGKDRVRAAREGTREIAFPAVSTTVAVIAIFLPVAFMEGVIGKFFFQFGVTISAAVALSLVEAVTLNPMRASRMLRHETRVPRVVRAVQVGMDWLAGFYRAWLDRALAHRWKVFGGSVLFFVLSLLVFAVIRQEFVPSQDQSTFGVRLETPLGSSLQATGDRLRPFEEYLLKQPEIARYIAIVGGFRGGQVNQAFMFVTMVPPGERDARQAEVMERIRGQIKKFPGLRGTLFDFSSRGLTASRGLPVEFSVRGDQWPELKKTADDILARLEKTGLVRDADINFREGAPEVHVIPNRERSSVRGVAMSDIVTTLAAAVGGVREGRFTNEGRRYDIRLRLEPHQWRGPDDLRALFVRNAYGELVPLHEVTEVVTVPTIQSLTRVDRRRAISFSANIPDNVSQQKALTEAERVAREVMPEGYDFYPGGGSQGFTEAFNSLYLAIWLGVIAAYMVLAAQFNSFLHPVAVLMALPFSISGALLALWGTGQSLNLYSMIGVILLMGIAKKNSILLVEFANVLRRRDGLDLRAAIVEAGAVRLRPILMTSISSIAAAVPAALAFGPGAESRIPMAIAVIGGMTLSTILTLFVVPCVYSLLARLERL